MPGAASAAVAASAIAVPEVKLLPAAGEVILTVGGVRSAESLVGKEGRSGRSPLY